MRDSVTMKRAPVPLRLRDRVVDTEKSPLVEVLLGFIVDDCEAMIVVNVTVCLLDTSTVGR